MQNYAFFATWGKIFCPAGFSLVFSSYLCSVIKHLFAMTKNILLPVALLCSSTLCGCAVTSDVTSCSTFDSTLREVQQDLQDQGFTLLSSDSDRRNVNKHAPGYYDNFEHGFSGANSIDYVYTNTYLFANDHGDTLTFSVSYQTGGDPAAQTTYVRDVYTSGCQTSNAKNYERLCGAASPIHKLDSMPKNSTVRR